MKRIFLLPEMILLTNALLAQNVGIGTTTPSPTAVLHVDAGTSVTNGLLVTGTYKSGSSTLPDLGSGSRLMFYPGKAAFRVGYVEGNLWNNANVGISSVGLGFNTQASGDYSTAMGGSTIASGNMSMASGRLTKASGYSSTVMGNESEAKGYVSTAMGNQTIAGGEYSTAMGNQSKANGEYSTAMGSNTEANGFYSTAMGRYTEANGSFSTAMGYNTVAKAYGGVAIGQSNDATDAPTANQAPIDRIFQIGNGIPNLRSNAVTVLRNGNVGIGSDALAPAYRLDVDGRMRIRSGGIAASSAGIWLNKNDNSGLLGFVGVDGNNDIGIFSSASNWSFLVSTSSGNAWLKGTLTQNSDARLKKNISPIQNALVQLSKLNGYHYNWKEENRDHGLQTGLLAQELEKVMPELVKADAQGTLSVNYSGLIPYLLEATKEQQAIILKQQSNILEQQSTMLQLQTQLNDLKKLVEQLAGKQ